METNLPPVKSDKERIRQNRDRKIDEKIVKACSFLNIVVTKDPHRQSCSTRLPLVVRMLNNWMLKT
jgi:hypothetical protein